jgi:hypothetical protein
VNHARSAATPPNPEMVQVGDAVGQRAQSPGTGAARARPPPGHPLDHDVKLMVAGQLDNAEDRFAAIAD